MCVQESDDDGIPSENIVENVALHKIFAVLRKLVKSIKSSAKQNDLFFGAQSESLFSAFLNNMDDDGHLDEATIAQGSNVNMHIASLIIDMCVRWMSLFELLFSLFMTRHHLNWYFITGHMTHVVLIETWNIISAVISILQPFKDLTILLQARKALAV